MREPASLPPELAIGPFHVHQARQAGVTRRRTRASDLVAPFRGVRMPTDARALEDLCAAYAVRMPGGQVFSHRTAAHLWGLPLPRVAESVLHVSAPEPQHPPRVRRVIGHRLAAESRIALVRGLPVVAAADAWCQLGASLGLDDLIAAGDRLLGWPEPLASLAELDDAIARFGRRRGAARVRAARAEIRPGSASPRETRLRLAVLRAGCPEPECNGAIELSNGTTTPGDLVFRPWRVLLEYDGEQHRTDERQFRRDVERLNALALDGWLVLRVGRLDPLPAVVDELRRALRSRGAGALTASG